MKKQQLNRVPGVKDFTGMNIVNSIIYFKEAIKREQDAEKREVLQVAFDKAQLNMKQYQMKMGY